MVVCMATAAQELIRIELEKSGEDLDTLVAAARDRGESWQTIAYWVRSQTGRAVTAETLRRWYNHLDSS